MAKLITIDPVADPRWDELVTSHPQATAYHLGDFAEIMHRCYRFEPSYLGLEDDEGRLVAGMPLMRTRGLYRGSRLVSLPLAPRGGPLATRAEDASALLRAACALAREAGPRLVIRCYQGGYDALVPELRAVRAFPSWIVRLPSDPDELRASWRSTLRHDVVESEAGGLTVRDAAGEDDLRRFYRLYLLTMRRHGAAPRPYRQIALSWRILGRSGRTSVLLVERDGTPLAGGLFHLLGTAMELRYLGSDARQHAQRPNHALYWHAQRWAIANGYTSFDMGGGDGSLAAFKRGWGAEPVLWTKYVQTSASEAASRAGTTIDKGQAPSGRHPTEFLWRRCPLAFGSAGGGLLYRYLADPSR